MDIESGSQTGYAAFLKALRKLMDANEKQYVGPDPHPSTLNAVVDSI
jgi:hypothetical protein